jgi:hypothetical protein
MDTSDSGLDEPGDEQQTKRLELGTLPETIGEADLEKLNLALGFAGNVREHAEKSGEKPCAWVAGALDQVRPARASKT